MVAESKTGKKASDAAKAQKVRSPSRVFVRHAKNARKLADKNERKAKNREARNVVAEALALVVDELSREDKMQVELDV